MKTPDRTKNSKVTKMSRTVLLVEDEQLIVFYIREILSPVGFDVLAFDDAPLALQSLTGNDIGLAIVDVGLHGMTGDHLVREIRKIRPTLPIIITTGYEPSQYENSFRADSRLRVLAKPFTEQNLLRQVEDLFGYQPTLAAG
jgi:CheY-like chemotaxis protein